MRVFLHVIPWKTDAEGFTKRIERFLEISKKRNPPDPPPMFTIPVVSRVQARKFFTSLRNEMDWELKRPSNH